MVNIHVSDSCETERIVAIRIHQYSALRAEVIG